MIKQLFNSNKSRVILPFILTIFVYILLFEFILPVNKVLPKPSMLIDSFTPLFQQYNFLVEISYSLSVIYGAALLAYLSIYLSFPLIIKLTKLLPGIKELITLGNYILPVFLIFLFEQWFGESILAEFIFALILITGMLKSIIINNTEKINSAYWESAQSLGLTESETIKKVVIKEFQPKILSGIINYNAQIWCIIIVYEYVCNSHGIGSIFRLSIDYNDLSILFLLIGLTIALLFITSVILKSLKHKFAFWN